MKLNKYFLFAAVYFFINSLGLPFGLIYTTLLSPFFYWWILVTRKKDVLLPFLFFITPFVIMQISLGVDESSYFISLLNYTAIYIFCQAFYTFLKVCKDIEKIFWQLLVINFIFCLVAIPLYFTHYYKIMWIQQYLTEGIDNFRRFKLFTYEASYYATLFTPIFAFYLWQIILRQNRLNSWLLLLLMIFLPYILSFSLGVISSLLVAGGITYLFYIRSLSKKKRLVRLMFPVLAGGIMLLCGLIVFFPENALFIRIGNILSGSDSSGKGRTGDAFTLAGMLLEKRSYAWGIGAGQIKILGADLIKAYYLYPLDYNVTTIPNVTAETLVIFGWIGLLLKMFLEVFLFFYTKVWTNYYRFFLFCFIFIYQFSGSFITNIAEYALWVLAFTPVFPQFNVRQPVKQPKAAH